MSYTVALITKSEDALAPLLNGIAMPVLLLSGVLLPMSMGPAGSRPDPSAERRVQLTDQLSYPAAPTRGGRVAPQDVHHDGQRQVSQLRDVVGADGGIVPGRELQSSCGMGG
jgi:hypothetical protein